MSIYTHLDSVHISILSLYVEGDTRSGELYAAPDISILSLYAEGDGNTPFCFKL